MSQFSLVTGFLEGTKENILRRPQNLKKVSKNIWHYVLSNCNVKTIGRFFQKNLVFSEYLNFTKEESHLHTVNRVVKAFKITVHGRKNAGLNFCNKGKLNRYPYKNWILQTNFHFKPFSSTEYPRDHKLFYALFLSSSL